MIFNTAGGGGDGSTKSTITVTFASDFVGADWTATAAGETIAGGTVGSDKTASFKTELLNTSITVSAASNGVTYNTVITTDKYYGQYSGTLNAFKATLTVSTDAGVAITVTNGTTKYTATAGSDGTASIDIYVSGTYTATATKGSETTDAASVSITTNGGSYTVECAFVKIYGVKWNFGASSTSLTRLTKSNDSIVNTSITTAPTAAVGTGAGSSPFDSLMPWSGMTEYNVVNNAIAYKSGDSGFSRSKYDTVVKIPEFWYKVVNDASAKTRCFYIADKETSGFTKHPGSGCYVGRYQTGSGYYSKSGVAPQVNMTRATARTQSAAKGSYWHLWGYAQWCAIWLLYLVEYADWNTQKAIGRGYVDSHSSAISAGGTDSMTYHTGRAAGTDGSTAVQYRHIENYWGNVYQWVDGYNASAYKEYICTDWSKMADNTSTGYTDIGSHATSNGYITGLNYVSAAPYAFQVSAVSGSDSTYVPDYFYTESSGWYVLLVGGAWGDASNVGAFYFDANRSSSHSGSFIGARLAWAPL